jgi:hypothetical protein
MQQVKELKEGTPAEARQAAVEGTTDDSSDRKALDSALKSAQLHIERLKKLAEE